jgi:hypothetical protein
MTIQATTPDGRPVRIANGGNVDFIAMATWCPYSKQMKRFLNDPKTKPYAAKRKIIFLFQSNEWPTVERELKEGGLSGLELQQRLKELKEDSGSASLFDPSFLDDLPGEAYLCTLPKEVNGFPSVMSGTGRDKIGWLITDLNMPESILMPTFTKYAPKKSAE